MTDDVGVSGAPRGQRLRLGIVYSPEDHSAVTALISTLSDRVDFTETGATSGVVVVISQAAVNNPNWMAAVRGLTGQHLVPLKIGAIYNAPPEIARINWAPYDLDNLDRTADVVMIAAHYDTSHHQIKRALEADARLWLARGRPTEDLILDLDRIRKAQAITSAPDETERATPLSAEFLAASVAAAKQTRRKRIWQATWRIGSLALAASLLVTAIIQFRDAATRIYLSTGAGDIAANVSAPLRAIKAASVLIDLPDNSAPGRSSATLAVQALAEEWPVIDFRPSTNGVMNASTLTTSGVVSVDGFGTMLWWGNDDEVDRWITVGDEPLYGLASTSTGDALAAFGTETVYVLDSSGQAIATHTLPFAPSHLAISEDAHTVAVSDGQSLTSFSETLEVSTGTVILDLVASPTTVFAVALGSRTVQLIDASNGTVVREWVHSLPEATIELAQASFNPELGIGFLAGPGNQLWSFGADEELHATGLATPVAPTSITVTPQGWALVSSPETGVILHLPAEGITYGRVCSTADNPGDVSVTADGRMFGCSTGMSLVVYELDRLGPVQDSSKLHRESALDEAADTRIPAVTAFTAYAGGADLTFSNGREYSLNMPITAQAHSASGTVAFASGDEITLLEATLNGPVMAPLGRVPGGGTITSIEWLVDGELVVETASGRSWLMRGCTGCLRADAAISKVANRLTQCFSPDQLAPFTRSVQARFGLRECTHTNTPGVQ